jgi:hypothetical protein
MRIFDTIASWPGERGAISLLGFTKYVGAALAAGKIKPLKPRQN